MMFHMWAFKRICFWRLPGQSPHLRTPPLSSSWGWDLHPWHSSQNADVKGGLGVWGGASIHGTDFKWTNCIFILSAAVFREAAVLRCFIISHLYHSLRTQSCSKFLVPGAILKNGWLSPSSECCIHGRGLPLTCGDNASFRLPARAVNGMLWPSSL